MGKDKKIFVYVPDKGKPNLIVKMKPFNADEHGFRSQEEQQPPKQRMSGGPKRRGGGISKRGLGKAFKKGGRV